MISARFALCSTFVFLGCLTVIPAQLSADWIQSSFNATFSSTTLDNSCPGNAHSRDTFNGSGTAILNQDLQFHEPGKTYAATIVYSSCNGLGTWVTGGLFTVTAGSKGSFSGQFDGNYITSHGYTQDIGEFLIKSESGVFANVDPVGDFFTSFPENGSQSVSLFTPEPESIGLAGIGIALLGLFAFRRKSLRQFRQAACD